MFSPLKIDTPDGLVAAAGLAPLAVHPWYQRQGHGRALVEKGLAGCRESGYEIVIVEGDPAYYSRFGFEPAGAKGLTEPFGCPPEAFMILELRPGALQGVSGPVLYPAAFDPFLA